MPTHITLGLADVQSAPLLVVSAQMIQSPAQSLLEKIDAANRNRACRTRRAQWCSSESLARLRLTVLDVRIGELAR